MSAEPATEAPVSESGGKRPSRILAGLLVVLLSMPMLGSRLNRMAGSTTTLLYQGAGACSIVTIDALAQAIGNGSIVVKGDEQKLKFEPPGQRRRRSVLGKRRYGTEKVVYGSTCSAVIVDANRQARIGEVSVTAMHKSYSQSPLPSVVHAEPFTNTAKGFTSSTFEPRGGVTVLTKSFTEVFGGTCDLAVEYINGPLVVSISVRGTSDCTWSASLIDTLTAFVTA